MHTRQRTFAVPIIAYNAQKDKLPALAGRVVAKSDSDGCGGDGTACISPEGDCRAALAVTVNRECNSPALRVSDVEDTCGTSNLHSSRNASSGVPRGRIWRSAPSVITSPKRTPSNIPQLRTGPRWWQAVGYESGWLAVFDLSRMLSRPPTANFDDFYGLRYNKTNRHRSERAISTETVSLRWFVKRWSKPLQGSVCVQSWGGRRRSMMTRPWPQPD
jgi:hypothetical protein